MEEELKVFYVALLVLPTILNLKLTRFACWICPPLMSSQGQANRYIKNMGKDPSFSLNGIDVIKLTDKNFLRTLENGIRFGRWVLLENVQARRAVFCHSRKNSPVARDASYLPRNI